MYDPDNVINALIEDVRKRPRDVILADIASNADVPLDWLRKFCNGKIVHPSFCNVTRLYKYFYSAKILPLE